MARFGRTPRTSWGLARRIEENYARQLQRLVRGVAGRIDGISSPSEIRRVLHSITNDPEFIAYANAMAENMARQVHAGVNQNWRRMAAEAAHKKGRLVFEELQRALDGTPLGETIRGIVSENSNLIRTIPERLDKEIASMMAKESAYKGIRSETLTRGINARFPHLLEYQARRIARTETSKAQMALTQARSQALGLNWYIWRTALDGDRVRDSHQIMEGVLVNWDDPPSPERLLGQDNAPGPYNAGNIFNCRCFAEPVIDISWIHFPCEIYLHGRIQNITQAAFEQIAA